MAIRTLARRSAGPGVEQAPIGIAIVAWALALVGFFRKSVALKYVTLAGGAAAMEGAVT